LDLHGGSVPPAIVGSRRIAAGPALLAEAADAVGVDGGEKFWVVVEGRHHEFLSVMS
jgi:hypothetical protein